MRNKYMLILIGIVVGVLLSSVVVVLAGNLDSPDVPANTLSYNLEDIYNRLDTGAAGAQTAFTEPAAGPGATGHTLDEVMAKAPAKDDTNGATTGEVANGKTFWGLNVAGGEWGLQTGTADCDGGAGVPKTGQTTLYATGDDGDLEKGVAWPVPRFTDNSDGTVTDNLTGLMWMKDADAGNDCDGGDTGTQTWAEALTSCAQCNTNTFAGYTDWRLPNVRELHSLIDFSQYNPALPSGHPFDNVQSGIYWSSTTRAISASSAWLVGLSNGAVASVVFESDVYYVWPVRGGQ